MRSIGSPRTPAFRSCKQIASRDRVAARIAHGTQQTHVSGWESIGFAKFSHLDVLRGPFTDVG
jgi:hypothetical protein